MKLHIRVKKDNIKHSILKDSHRCMIADALHQALPSACYVIVDLQAIKFSDDKTRKRYTCFTPPLAQARLLDFDAGKKVEPFAITVKSVEEMPMGWQAQRSKNATRRGRKYPGKGKRKEYAKRRKREFGVRLFH